MMRKTERIATETNIIAAVNRAMKTRYQLAASGSRDGTIYDFYRETLWDLVDKHPNAEGTGVSSNLSKDRLREWELSVRPLVPLAKTQDQKIKNYYAAIEAENETKYLQALKEGN